MHQVYMWFVCGLCMPLNILILHTYKQYACFVGSIYIPSYALHQIKNKNDLWEKYELNCNRVVQ